MSRKRKVYDRKPAWMTIPQEVPYTVSRSRLNGERFQDYTGLQKTLMNLPDFECKNHNTSPRA